MSTPKYAVLWDADGTLIDTAEHHFHAWERFAKEIDKPFTRDDFAATFGKRNPEVIRQLFDPDASDEKCAEWANRKEAMYRESVHAEGTELLPGVAALLDGFAAHGWPQAIGSSAPKGNLDLLLDVTKTRKYFTAVIGGTDVEKGKPDPEVFLTAAQKLGVAPENCVVFEDAVAGVEAARAGGMKCVAVTFVGHHSEDKLREAGADVVVGTLKEVTVDRVVELFGA